MTTESDLKKIAKNSKLSLQKTKIAAAALCAGVNACLDQRLFTLDVPCGTPETRKTFTTEFILAGRHAVVKAREISHYEMSIVVAIPNDKCTDTYYWLIFPKKLPKGYDLLCFCWLERKTGKFLQGVLHCCARRDPWINALADLKIKPAGYRISTKFFL